MPGSIPTETSDKKSSPDAPSAGRGHSLAALAAVALACFGLGCGGDIEARMAEVRALQDVGQFTASIDELREIMAISPDLPEAAYRLGVALVQTGEPSRAVWALQKAAESPAYAIVAGLLLASAQLNNQNFEEVVRAADRVLEVDPERQVALQLRAKGHLGSAQLEEALEDTERLVELYPEDYSVRVLHATVLSDLDRIDEARVAHDIIKALGARSGDPAIETRGCLAPAIFAKEHDGERREVTAFYEDCIAKYPTDSFVINQSMQYFNGSGRPERATELIRAAVEQAPESLSLRSTLAERLRGDGDAEGAEKVLREAVESFDSAAAWNLLAAFYRRQHEPDKALEAIEKVIELSRGGSDQLRFTHADVLVDLGLLDEAEEVARSLGEPTYAKLINGRIMLERGDARAALDSFDQGIRNWPNNVGARYLAGLAARELGDYDRAISELREAVRTDKSATDAALLLAHIHFDRGEYKQAASFAATAAGASPGSKPTALVIRARALTEMGRTERAAATIDALAQIEGQEVAAAVERIALARAEKGPESALAAVEASGLDPTRPENEEILRAVAENLAELGRVGEAEKAVAAALSAAPDSSSLHELHGTILARGERFDEARVAYDRARELDADNGSALAGLATIAADRGDLLEAISLFDRAAELSEDRSDFQYSAAQLALASGDAAGAEKRLREVIRKAPGEAGARNDLAWLLAERGTDLDMALALVQEARRLIPSPDVLDTLGWVHLKRGETQAAVAAFREAIAARPDSASIRYRLGMALDQAGQAEEAREMLRTALGAGDFPEADDAKRELARLERP